MKQGLLSILILATIIINANAQNVNIPDANFKAYLVGNTDINTNGDTAIQTSEATAFTGTIDCSNLSISDLTGIETFTALTQLYSNNNQLTSINVSANINLTIFYCKENQLTSLDVSANANLTTLYCSQNQLASLDVSANASLTSLFLPFNQLTSLDLSANVNLTTLSCSVNQLTSLNVANGNNNNLTFFAANSNPNLTCIQVDDVAWSTTNWTSIDAQTSFSLNCATVGTSKLEKNRTKIYPNPVQDQLFFELENEEITAITIIDFSGKVVRSIANTTIQSINVSNLPQGIYLLNISTKNGVSTNRFIKQ